MAGCCLWNSAAMRAQCPNLCHRKLIRCPTKVLKPARSAPWLMCPPPSCLPGTAEALLGNGDKGQPAEAAATKDSVGDSQEIQDLRKQVADLQQRWEPCHGS
jgi:hypothetical protein